MFCPNMKIFAMMNKAKYLIIMLLLCLLSCEEKPKQPSTVSQDQMKSSMEKANRYLVNEEETDISNYVKRHGLDMVSTGTGLRYQVMKAGQGKQIEKGQKVSLEYQLESISGDLFYSSENEGVKTFVVGDGSAESGLDEAMLHLHYGDVAKVIIPAHLGYGLHGDDNKIPSYATLVYTIKITENQ